MAHFNLEDYETVEERIKRFYILYEDGRIITENITTAEDRKSNTWVMKATIYISDGDQSAGLAKATGHAFEIDGSGMANKTAALENCETSAIGRALANMSLSGNKRASREEMQKVAAGSREQNNKDYLKLAEDILNIEDLRALYAEAKAAKAPAEVLDKIKDYGSLINNKEQD